MSPPTAAQLQRRIEEAADPEPRSFGARFVASPVYERLRAGRWPTSAEDRGTTSVANTSELIGALRLRSFADLGVFSTEPIPHPALVPTIARVPDLIETIPVQRQNVLLGVESSETFGATAAGVSETGLLPEPALTAVGPPQQVLLPRFGMGIPIARSALDEAGYVQSLLNSRVVLGLRMGLERQALVGAAADMAGVGVVNATGTQAIAKGTEARLFTVARGVQALQNAGWYIGELAAVGHPGALYNLRSELTTGNVPLAAALSGAIPEITNWLPSRLVPAGQIVVGDFLHGACLLLKGPLSLELSKEHSQWLVNGVVQPWGTAGTPQTTINFDTSDWVELAAWMRAYVWIRRPDAFAVCTGL